MQPWKRNLFVDLLSYFIALWLVSILQRPFPATVSWPERVCSKCVRFSCKASGTCHSKSSAKVVFCLKEGPEGVKSELWFSWSWVWVLGKRLVWEIEFKWMYKRSNIWTARTLFKVAEDLCPHYQSLWNYAMVQFDTIDLVPKVSSRI